MSGIVVLLNLVILLYHAIKKKTRNPNSHYEFKASVALSELIRGLVMYPAFGLAYYYELVNTWTLVEEDRILIKEINALPYNTHIAADRLTSFVAYMTVSIAALDCCQHIFLPNYKGKFALHKNEKIIGTCCCLWFIGTLIAVISAFAFPDNSGFSKLYVGLPILSFVIPSGCYVFVRMFNHGINEERHVEQMKKWKSTSKKTMIMGIFVLVYILPYDIYMLKERSPAQIHFTFAIVLCSLLFTLGKSIWNYRLLNEKPQ